MKNSASLFFCIENFSIKTRFSILICKKANSLEATLSVRVKNSASLIFCIENIKTKAPLDNISKEANKTKRP
jgi:hypothetical protein